MDITITGNELAQICNQERVAKRKLGARCARQLKARLNDLLATENVLDLPAGRPHSLTGNRSGQYAVTLHGGIRLIFEPDNDPPPCHENGGINWLHVTKVRIVEIGDYHD